MLVGLVQFMLTVSVIFLCTRPGARQWKDKDKTDWLLPVSHMELTVY